MEALLAPASVDANTKDNEGRSPISWAIRNSHIAVVMALLLSGKVDADAIANGRRVPSSTTDIAYNSPIPLGNLSNQVRNSLHIRQYQLRTLHQVLASHYREGHHNTDPAIRLRLPTVGSWPKRIRFQMLSQAASGYWQTVEIEVDVGRVRRARLPGVHSRIEDICKLIEKARVMRQEPCLHIINNELWTSRPALATRHFPNDRIHSLGEMLVILAQHFCNFGRVLARPKPGTSTIFSSSSKKMMIRWSISPGHTCPFA